MAWPTENIDTSNFDQAGDDASQARVEIEKMANHVNDIKDSRSAADGIASLDSGGKVPEGELPILPADLGGTGQQAYTVGDILYANATDALTKLPAGTLGYVLKSNGPGAAPSWQQEGGGLTAGTRMIFQNSAAPTGWTKETNSAFNDMALRIVTGSVTNGGATGFSTVFGTNKATSGHELVYAEVPRAGSGNTGSPASIAPSTSNPVTSQAHTHGLEMDIKYLDFILAQKN